MKKLAIYLAAVLIAGVSAVGGAAPAHADGPCGLVDVCPTGSNELPPMLNFEPTPPTFSEASELRQRVAALESQLAMADATANEYRTAYVQQAQIIAQLTARNVRLQKLADRRRATIERLRDQLAAS